MIIASNGVKAEADLIIEQELDNNCAKVQGIENKAVYIFKESNVYSEKLDVVADGRYVEIKNLLYRVNL